MYFIIYGLHVFMCNTFNVLCIQLPAIFPSLFSVSFHVSSFYSINSARCFSANDSICDLIIILYIRPIDIVLMLCHSFYFAVCVLAMQCSPRQRFLVSFSALTTICNVS